MTWTLLVLLLVSSGSKAADAWTTSDCIARGCRERISAWATGPRPSPLRLALTAAAGQGAQTAALVYTERSRHAWVRWTGRAATVALAGWEVDLAAHTPALCRRGACLAPGWKP